MQFIKPLETISARRGSITTIFADFTRIAACSIAPRHEVEGVSLSIREDEYMDTVRRYDARELDLFKTAFHTLIEEMERHPHKDVLGSSWLDFSSKSCKQARGEFYTPPELSECIAMMTSDAPARIEAGRPFTVCEPACGAGGMILAVAKQFAPDHWHLPRFTAMDINPVACDMTYINTSLWSIACEVLCGDTIRMKFNARWPNIHWLRVGEDQRRMIERIFSAPSKAIGRMLDAEVIPDPTPPKPTQPTKKPAPSTPWIQTDLFAA